MTARYSLGFSAARHSFFYFFLIALVHLLKAMAAMAWPEHGTPFLSATPGVAFTRSAGAGCARAAGSL